MSTAEKSQTAGSTPEPNGGRPKSAARGHRFNLQQLNELSLLVALIVAIIFFTIFAPHFLSSANLWNIVNAAAITGVVAWSSTLVIVAGEIDVSIGPAVAFWSVAVAELNDGTFHLPLFVAVLITLIGGAAVGAFAGWLRGRFGVPSFIVTLGLWLALRGLARSWSATLPVPITPNHFMTWLGGKLWTAGPDVGAIIMLVSFVIFLFISRSTTYGRSVFAVGGNARAALLTGIRVNRIRVILFATSGFMAAILGIIFTARLNSGYSEAAQGLEFDVIAAVVVGGTSLSGGRGSMLGTLLGVMFIAVIGNGLIPLGVDQYLQSVVQGALIVGAVLINMALGRRGGAAKT